MKLPTHTRMLGALALLTCSATLALMPEAGYAGPKETPIIEPTVTPAYTPLHALLKLDFSDNYITPRGLNVENQELVFQPLFLIFYDLYHNPEAFLSDVTLTLGVWSSIHARRSGAEAGNWNEFDPILGLGFKFGKYWKFDINYTAFESMTRSYPTSQHLQLQLSFNDAALTGNKVFSINPYIAYWKELMEKATVVFLGATSVESYYFTVGMTPTVDLGVVKFEVPTFVNFVDDDFYQKANGMPGGSGLAVICTGLRATVPLKFVPPSMGSWAVYAGVKYYHLDNAGLIDGNQALGSTRSNNLVQFHGGLSIFF